MAKATPAKAKRNKQVVALKLAGLSFTEIGKKFKISRAMAHLIFHRDLPKYQNEIIKTIDSRIK